MMCELFRVVTCATAILICFHCVAGSSDASTITEKSEVVLKFITYAIKIPSINKSTSGQKNTNNKKLEFDQVNCSSKTVTKAMSDLQKKIKCIPRDAVVELTAPDGSNVDPQTVVVKRCGGMCFGRQKCISSKQIKTEFYVTTIQENSATVFCNRIQVYEDVECQCGCITKEKDCTQKQTFNKDLCKCDCSNKNNEMACRNQNQQNFYWNSNTCTCNCKSKKICTTGTVWMESQCKCVKKM